MNIHLAIGTALALASALWPGSARSETVYRCGDTYSQVPCPGGSTVDASDPRTPAQKAQADAAARQAVVSATRLEKERLALERSGSGTADNGRMVAGPKRRPAQGKATESNTLGATQRKSKAAPDYFTAAAPPTEKKPEKSRRPPAANPPATSTEPLAKR